MIEVEPLAAEQTRPIHGRVDCFYSIEVNGGAKYGNGFMLAMWPDVIVTAAHVVRRANRVTAWSRVGPNAVGIHCPAIAIDSDKEPDLALLQLPFPIKPSGKLMPGVAPPHGNGRLCAFITHDHWKSRELKHPPTNFETRGQWIFYSTPYGQDGASGGAMLHNGAVIGVYHGSFSVSSKIEYASTVLDIGFLANCRARLYQ